MTPTRHTHTSRIGSVLALPWFVSAFLGAYAEPEMPLASSEPSTDLVGLPNPPSLGEAPPPIPSTPTANVTVNLILKLVKKGILDAAEAQEMIKQAEAEAESARLAAEASAPANDDVRVSYVPEVVKAQIRDEIKDEVLAQAKTEHWATPGKIPDWVERNKLIGDFRLRFEADLYPSGNDNTGAFPNFNAINTGAPFDVSGTQFSPQYNVDQERQRLKMRARLGFAMDLEDGWTAGFRIGTGETNTPVTQNQGLGVANQGQGGNFSKYAVWLDRAFLRYDVGGLPERDLAVSFGRFDNPFFTTTRMVWEDEIGFDGVVLHAHGRMFEGFTPFLTAGIFPVFNTDLNFSSIQPTKFESSDKWLYGAQIGFDLKLNKDVSAKFAGAYFDFQHIEGQLSDPYTPLTPQDAGNTDNTRPSFAQRGNTYMALRNIIPSALNNFGTSYQYQYFGLATPFRELMFNGKIDINSFEPCQISLFGEFVKNLAFDQTALSDRAVNNRGPLPALPTTTTTTAADGTTTSTKPSPVGAYEGGDTGWEVGVKFGKSVFEKRGDWNASISYRYLESDATVDGFNDSDFGGGGTNLKGYTIGASVALSPRVRLGLRYFGASAIAGPPYKSDIYMFDINAKF